MELRGVLCGSREADLGRLPVDTTRGGPSRVPPGAPDPTGASQLPPSPTSPAARWQPGEDEIRESVTKTPEYERLRDERFRAQAIQCGASIATWLECFDAAVPGADDTLRRAFVSAAARWGVREREAHMDLLLWLELRTPIRAKELPAAMRSRTVGFVTGEWAQARREFADRYLSKAQAESFESAIRNAYKLP